MRVLLLLILVLIVAWWASRALERRKNRPRPTPPAKKLPESMLACDHCGVHIPESEGVHSESGFFCCDEHRRLGNSRQ